MIPALLGVLAMLGLAVTWLLWVIVGKLDELISLTAFGAKADRPQPLRIVHRR